MHERLRFELRQPELYPLPEVAWRILCLTSDLETDSRQLEGVIDRDPTLVAHLLHRANSAQFSVSGQVSTIHRAAVILGTRRLRSIAVLLSMQGVYGRSKLGQSVWEHCLAVALASRELAPHCSVRDSEEAFVAGLLHDIGKSVLDRCLPGEYADLVSSAGTGSLDLLEVEQERLGIDHAQVGAEMARHWGLPVHLEEAIRLHHAPSEAVVDPTGCALVQLADATCRRLGIGSVAPSRPVDPETEADPYFLLDPEQVAQICAPVRPLLESETAYFGIHSPAAS